MQNSVLTQAHKGEILLEISVNDISGSHVDLSYTYSRPAKEHNDPLHRPERLIPGATDIPEEFYQELAALQDLEPPFKAIFDAEEVRGDRVLHWLMRTLMPDPSDAQPLAKHGVVLMGPCYPHTGWRRREHGPKRRHRSGTTFSHAWYRCL